MGGEMVYVIEGQVWRDKRDAARKLTITGIFELPVRDRRGEPTGAVIRYANVRRNTSRRRQAIRVETLYRKYRRAGVVE